MKKKREEKKPLADERTMQAYLDLLPESLRQQYRRSGARAADVWELHRQVEELERSKTE